MDTAAFEPPQVSSPKPAPPKTEITPEDLRSPLGVALQEHGLLEVFPVLKENDVDYDSLLLLVEDDLRDLEIKLGTRKKVFIAFPSLFFLSFFLKAHK